MSARIVAGYVPGAIGWVTELHGTYYARHWDLGLFFEARAATELAAFLSRFDAACDGFWVALDEHERIAGSITIDGVDAETTGGRLRWFIVAPEQHGRGLGTRLLDTAIAFCRAAGMRRVYLTTFAGLDAARHLYERVGFRLIEEAEDRHWGRPLIEQVFAIDL